MEPLGFLACWWPRVRAVPSCSPHRKRPHPCAHGACNDTEIAAVYANLSSGGVFYACERAIPSSAGHSDATHSAIASLADWNLLHLLSPWILLRCDRLSDRTSSGKRSICGIVASSTVALCVSTHTSYSQSTVGIKSRRYPCCVPVTQC